MPEPGLTITQRSLQLACDIIAAYVSHNHIQGVELPNLMTEVQAVIAGILAAKPYAAEIAPARPTPQEIRQSISCDHLVSFEDGKPYKILRRHLAIRGLTPESYRAKWGLPKDYPMVARNYAEKRSLLAKQIGLGRPSAMTEREPSKDKAA